MGAPNAEEIRRSFAVQAGAFEDPSRAFASSDVAAWMTSNTPTRPTDVVLEVAAGTGLFGRAIAPRVAAVVAIDITLEMLDEGHRGAESSGVTNIVFQVGDATRLPFLDRSFDRVISRLAIHHFDDPLPVLREMVRVCRLDGTVTVIDMVVPDPADEAAFNDLERRRDPAHTRALTREQLRTAVAEAGAEVMHTSTWENVLDGERWMAQTNTPQPNAEFIRAAWSSELAGGPRTGMEPKDAGGRTEFVHYWDLLVATRSP